MSHGNPKKSLEKYSQLPEAISRLIPLLGKEVLFFTCGEYHKVILVGINIAEGTVALETDSDSFTINKPIINRGDNPIRVKPIS